MAKSACITDSHFGFRLSFFILKVKSIHWVSTTLPPPKVWLIIINCHYYFYQRSDYSPRSRANSYKAGNDDVFSLFHAETD